MFNSTIGVGTQKPDPRKLKDQSAELLDAAGKPKGSVLFGEPVKNAEYGTESFLIAKWDRPVFVACHSKSLQNIRCKDIGDCVNDYSLLLSENAGAKLRISSDTNRELVHPYEGTASGRPVYIVFCRPKEEGALPKFSAALNPVPSERYPHFDSECHYEGDLDWA